jgi:hypothetical protein
MNSPHDCPYDHATMEDRRKSDADHSIRIALLEQGMESIKNQLKGINENMTKLVWLIFSALILAILKTILIP